MIVAKIGVYYDGFSLAVMWYFKQLLRLDFFQVHENETVSIASNPIKVYYTQVTEPKKCPNNR